MSELKERELLSILTAVFSYYLSKCNYKETATKYEEAHQQIKELIQKPEVTEEWITGKAFLLQGAVNNFVALRQSLTKMLKEAGVEITK